MENRREIGRAGPRRRRAIVWLSVLLFGGIAGTPRAETPTAPGALSQTVYVRDVEFLLRELEQRAGHFFALKGIDWPAVSREFRARAVAVTNDPGHIRLGQQLVARLRDGHASLRNVAMTLPDESLGRRRTGPGVHLLSQGDQVFIRAVFGSAQILGLQSGVEVLQVEDLPAREWLDRRVATLREDSGYSTDHQALYAACHWGLAEWEGTQIRFTIKAATESRRVTVTRQGGANFIPQGPLFPPAHARTLRRQTYYRLDDELGYIHLRDVPGELPAQLDMMLGKLGAIAGLILDLRANGGGGCDHGAVFARFLAPGARGRRFSGTGAPHPFTGPVVMIVDAGTRSAGETLAAMFQDEGRALIIGDTPTAGMSSSKETLRVPSGLFSVYFSVRSNWQNANQGRGIEGIGIPPQERRDYDPADLRRGVDTMVRLASERLRHGPLPIEYQPPKPK